MPRKKVRSDQSLERVETSKTAEETLLEEVQDHQRDSERWLGTLREDWEVYESILIGKVEDKVSKESPNRVFDPRLSTITFERTARVMFSLPKGKAFAKSANDPGKNALMNLLIRHDEKEMNENLPYLMKLRLWDFYSQVYGTMFALIPWRVNLKNGYIGPEFLVLPIRSCYPQPGIQSTDDADWFTVQNIVSITWLLKQDPQVWNMEAIRQLEKDMKERKDKGDAEKTARTEQRSYVQRTYFPDYAGDLVYPRVEIFTEYRGDKWITWTPQQISKKNNRPYLLRTVENPYPEGMLPIVAKHNFPLIDSPIALGEFARGKSLQFAINSLINLYLVGVKHSIFPPIHINVDNVTPSSIKWEAGARWFMQNPNRDVQVMQNLNPQGIQTFTNTYGFLVSALLNQAGTTEVSKSSGVEASMGKTPQALRIAAAMQNARDDWDQFMLEEALKQGYRRFTALNATKLEKPAMVRLFGPEIEEIKKEHPDVGGLLKENGGEGTIEIGRESLADTDQDGKVSTHYDYEIEAGSTVKPNIESETENITTLLRSVLENKDFLLAEFQRRGEDIHVPNLFKLWAKRALKAKEVDQIVVPYTETPSPAQNPQLQPEVAAEVPFAPGQIPTAGTGTPPPPEAPPPQVEIPPVNDPEIAAAIQSVLGGVSGVPQTR